MLFTGFLEFLKQFSVFYYDISDSVYLIVVLCCVIHQDVKRVKIRFFCCTNLFLFMLDILGLKIFFILRLKVLGPPPPIPPMHFQFSISLEFKI